MFNYLAFIHKGIREASEDAYADGRKLTSECFTQLRALDNPEQFPPRLLILLASPAYLENARAQALLDGIHSVSYEPGHGDIPLIGSSVAGVFFDRRLYDRGALLICLASNLLEAECAVSEGARDNSEGVVATLLAKLNFNFSGQGNDPNPLGNLLLFTFFPGFGDPDAGHWYPGPDLLWHLRAQMHARVPLVGGGSSADDRTRAGLQFAGRGVYTDAVVAAKLITGFPFTASIGHGLEPAGSVYHVAELDPDRRTIRRFREGTPTKVLGLNTPEDFRLLGELSLDSDPLITVARAAPDHSGAVRMLRELQPCSSLELMRPDRDRMRHQAKDLVDWSLRRLHIENPAGIIGIHCAAWRRFGPPISDLIDDAQSVTGVEARNYVGGFFDGEIGVGQTGRSLFGNWCVSRLCLGDELRERTPFYSGFEAMARLSQAMATVDTLEEAIGHSLDLIHRTGYPGAMLSSLMKNEDRLWLVPTQAKGSRYERILARAEEARREVSDEDLFDKIAKGKASPLILETQTHPGQEFAVYRGLNVFSQYIKPIKNFEGQSLAFLQIDLGDLRYKKKRLREEELRVIDSLSLVVEATINRLTNHIEAQIAHELDAALVECLRLPTLSEALRRYIEEAAKIFRVDMGHIRLARYEDRKLVLVAGTGKFYEAQRWEREFLSMDDEAPTAKAFQSKRRVVVNDVRHSQSFQQLLRVYQQHPQLTDALNEISSYANVVFKNELGQPMGTINLISKRPWFFTRPLVRSLEAMGQRVSLLIEQHRRQNHQHFLSEVSTVYEYTEEFDAPLKTLGDATLRCRDAANADIACLYLWDKELRRFVLYAQAGWDERWVQAASFGQDDRWIGRIAMEKGPLYIPDVYQFKVEHGTETLLRYSKAMFGRYFSPNFTVESLVLPLKLKGKQQLLGQSPDETEPFSLLSGHGRPKAESPEGENKEPKNLGVFVLYRRFNQEQTGKGESFTVTNRAILEQAANNLAVMAHGQLRRENWLWERKYNKQRTRVLEALSNANKKWSLEENLCRSMLATFEAQQVSFYQIVHNREGMDLRWVEGYEPKVKHNNQPGEKRIPAQKPDEFLLHALKDWARSKPNERKLQAEKFISPNESDTEPELRRKEGKIRRLCLPLAGQKDLIGLLDMHWGDDQLPQRLMISAQFGKQISEAYIQQQNRQAEGEIRLQKERNRLAAQTMGVMLFQSTHRVMNLVQELRSLPRLIEAAASDQERKRRISQLTELINSATDRIEQPMEIAKRTRTIEPAKNHLRPMIVRALDEVPRLSPIEVQLDVNEKIAVWADLHLVREAFLNIIQNACKAMPEGGRLKIQATLTEHEKTAQIVFSDTGQGMSREEIEAALRGLQSKRNSTGMGVLASSLMITANNGKFWIKSEPGIGTQVFVTLPVAH